MLSHVPGQSALLITAVTHFLISAADRTRLRGWGGDGNFKGLEKYFKLKVRKIYSKY